ncbi:MAG: ATP-binding protein [Bryobacteraceae bacterium]
MAINIINPVSRAEKTFILAGCIFGVCALSAAERFLGNGMPLGGFFLLPIVVCASFISRWSILSFSLGAAVIRELLVAAPWGPASPQRLAVSSVAFVGVGLFAGELVRNRRMADELSRKTEDETRVRVQAATEIRALVESSPIGVLTVDGLGNIEMSNDAARRLLGFDTGTPEGEPVVKYIPLVERFLKSRRAASARVMVEASGTRRDGEAFFSQAWVSAYESAAGRRLTVILSDITEQIRDREESGLRQLLSNSRIIAGAVSHELRNLAATATVLHLNMRKHGELSENPDYKALGTVLESILKLSASELSDASEQSLEGLNVGDVLAELRTIIGPSLEESGIAAEWDVDSNLPNVRANHTGLLQVFLNLTKNARAALQATPSPRIRITAYELSGNVVVRVSDNGPGVSAAERLFQPFQPGASSTGLGLFVSRAMIRTFGGELHYTQPAGACTFIIELPVMQGTA